jgi:hypothetical protein
MQAVCSKYAKEGQKTGRRQRSFQHVKCIAVIIYLPINDQRILFSVGRFSIRWKQKLLEFYSNFDELFA